MRMRRSSVNPNKHSSYDSPYCLLSSRRGSVPKCLLNVPFDHHANGKSRNRERRGPLLRLIKLAENEKNTVLGVRIIRLAADIRLSSCLIANS